VIVSQWTKSKENKSKLTSKSPWSVRIRCCMSSSQFRRSRRSCQRSSCLSSAVVCMQHRMTSCIGRSSCCTSRSAPYGRSSCCFCWSQAAVDQSFNQPQALYSSPLTRNSASSARTEKCTHDHRFHTPSSLLLLHMKWDNHLNSCWRFQFSPETCRTKWELQKRVCRSSKIASCMDLHTNVHRIRRWV
jgi:hypothetical protein